MVFLEFIIDPACSIVFEAEEADARDMAQPPPDPSQPLFNARMVGMSVLVGLAVLVPVCALYG